MSDFSSSRGPENYATAQARLYEAEATAAMAAARGEGRIIPPPVKPYSYTRGVLYSLLTIPIAAAFVALFGLSSPIAAVATASLTVGIAFALFAHGSGRTPVAGRDFTAATGIGIITMTAAVAVAYPYGIFITYAYNDGIGGFLSPEFTQHLTVWISEHPSEILIPSALVTVVSLIVVFRKARAARASTVTA
ncbi:MAG: hypothetical protein ACOH14_10990 [Rhodoglobus sp.]